MRADISYAVHSYLKVCNNPPFAIRILRWTLAFIGNAFRYLQLPRRLAQEIMLLACIREVPGSNLGQDTDYPD
jgi:hypothetical protein